MDPSFWHQRWEKNEIAFHEGKANPLLVEHFHKSPPEATHVMLQVHYKGVGVAGVYPKEVAETKVAEVTAAARAEGMPLKLTLEADGGKEDGGREEGAP